MPTFKEYLNTDYPSLWIWIRSKSRKIQVKKIIFFFRLFRNYCGLESTLLEKKHWESGGFDDDEYHFTEQVHEITEVEKTDILPTETPGEPGFDK
jgi:hypothetical protein